MNRSDQRLHHERVDPHVGGRWLSDLVLGAQDGLVNTLGIVLGVAAASADAKVTWAAGIAAAFAEAISMGAVAYTSSVARGELFRSERDREYRHVTTTPDIERDEIRRLYERKGFAAPLLDRVVDTICSNRDVWVAVMMAEEHGLTEVDRAASMRSALIVGSASLGGSLLPCLPFRWFAGGAAAAFAIGLGAIGLVVLGVVKARVTDGPMARSALSLAAIGVASALAGYVVGALLGVG